MNPNVTKEKLLEACSQIVQQRYDSIKRRISGIEESLFGESKSSAGDKHETSRAMLQIDRENAGRQLREIEKLQLILNKIDVHKASSNVRVGSLVFTNTATFFLSISVGEVGIDDEKFLCLATQSPIGTLLLGKVKGETVVFRDREYMITAVL